MPTYAIRHRRDTTANWLAANPILLDGELGYERTDDGRLLCKMGDGVQGADGSVTGTHWADLPYCSGPAGPSPEFEWSGTSLRFRNPDGTWGEWANLQGVRGLQGLQGEPGPTGESVPATRSSLGGVKIGPGLQVTAEGCISIQPDGVTTTVDEDGLLSALGGNLLLNSEQWITESGTWTAKSTGWHELFLIGGGAGAIAVVKPTNVGVGSGFSGDYKTFLVYLTAGQQIPVVIGAGGLAGDSADFNRDGGNTSFGDYSTVSFAEEGWQGFSAPMCNLLRGAAADNPNGVILNGAGIGASTYSQWPSFYGAGGSLRTNSGGVVEDKTAGKQGAIRVRWHDPAKANGPLPAPALFSARRIAPRAAAAPVTVNLYDPETGQGSVWREEDAPAKLAEGLITEEA